MSEPKDNRVPIMMSNAELEAIDDWRFENRIATRSEAIRRLCQIALTGEEFPLMNLAVHLIEHYIPESEIPLDKRGSMKSGNSLDEDVRRLCFAIFEERSRMGIFKRNDDVDAAIEAAKSLTQDYIKMKNDARSISTRTTPTKTNKDPA